MNTSAAADYSLSYFVQTLRLLSIPERRKADRKVSVALASEIHGRV